MRPRPLVSGAFLCAPARPRTLDTSRTLSTRGTAAHPRHVRHFRYCLPLPRPIAMSAPRTSTFRSCSHRSAASARPRRSGSDDHACGRSCRTRCWQSADFSAASTTVRRSSSGRSAKEGAALHRSNTTFPPTMVINTCASRMRLSGTERMSSDRTTRSASFPCSIEPLTASSNINRALLMVASRKAS